MAKVKRIFGLMREGVIGLVMIAVYLPYGIYCVVLSYCKPSTYEFYEFHDEDRTDEEAKRAEARAEGGHWRRLR